MALVVSKIDPVAYARLVKILGPETALSAARSAVAKTLNTARTMVSRDVSGKLNIPKKIVEYDSRNKRPVLYVYQEKGQPEGVLQVRDSPVPAMAFSGATFGPDGLHVRFQKGKPMLHFRHAFRARFESGHVGAFAKTVKKREGFDGHATFKRYPIKGIYGPSVRSLMGDAALSALAVEVLGKIQRKLMMNLQSAINWKLKLKAGEVTPEQSIEG